MENKLPYANKQEELEAFRAEIVEIKRLELRSREEGGETTVHFTECNPNELKEEDKKLYEKYLSNNLNFKEFKEYQDKITKSLNNSQKIFLMYIANKFQNKLGAEFLEKRKQKSQ